MPNAPHPMEVGRAAYEVLAHDINTRLGHRLLLPWAGLPHEEKRAWIEAGRAERAAAGVPLTPVAHPEA